MQSYHTWIYLLFLQLTTTAILTAQSHDNNTLQYIVRWDYTSGMAKLAVPSDRDTIIHEILTKKYIASNSNICMSDSVGQFIFASNGLKVYNKYFDVMTNGDSISFPDQYSDFNAYLSATFDSSYSTRTINAIPLPGKKDEYIFLHTTIYIDTLFRYQSALRYTRIDMRDGLGIVVEKNILIQSNTTQLPLLIKHGNGIDWWLITAHGRSNTIYIYQINTNGIVGPFIQNIGTEIDSNSWYKGIYDFHDLISSMDGKVILSQKENFVDIFGFDRCSGMLEFKRKIDQSDIADARIIGGSEISPSSQYYYYTQGRNIFQLSLSDNKNNILKLGHITSPSTPHISFIRNLNNKLILGTFRFEKIIQPYYGQISEPNMHGTRSQPNLNMFYNLPVHSPVGAFGQIPTLPNYKLMKIENYSSDNCHNDFFDQLLEPIAEFMFYGNTYKTLIRNFKK